MNLSLILFVATAVLLVLCFRYAWAVVRDCGLLTWLTLLTVGLCSCSTQVATAPDGTKLVNNNLLSKGSLLKRPDGTVVMSGDAEKAADTLGKYGDGLLKLKTFKLGAEALESVGNNAIDAVE